MTQENLERVVAAAHAAKINVEITLVEHAGWSVTIMDEAGEWLRRCSGISTITIVTDWIVRAMRNVLMADSQAYKRFNDQIGAPIILPTVFVPNFA